MVTRWSRLEIVQCLAPFLFLRLKTKSLIWINIFMVCLDLSITFSFQWLHMSHRRATGQELIWDRLRWHLSSGWEGGAVVALDWLCSRGFIWKKFVPLSLILNWLVWFLAWICWSVNQSATLVQRKHLLDGLPWNAVNSAHNNVWEIYYL